MKCPKCGANCGGGKKPKVAPKKKVVAKGWDMGGGKGGCKTKGKGGGLGERPAPRKTMPPIRAPKRKPIRTAYEVRPKKGGMGGGKRVVKPKRYADDRRR